MCTIFAIFYNNFLEGLYIDTLNTHYSLLYVFLYFLSHCWLNDRSSILFPQSGVVFQWDQLNVVST